MRLRTVMRRHENSFRSGCESRVLSHEFVGIGSILNEAVVLYQTKQREKNLKSIPLVKVGVKS